MGASDIREILHNALVEAPEAEGCFDDSCPELLSIYLRASGSGRQPQRRMARLQMSGSSQRRDPSAALLSSSDRSRLAALNVMLTPCPVP